MLSEEMRDYLRRYWPQITIKAVGLLACCTAFYLAMAAI